MSYVEPGWPEFVDLVEEVMADDELLPQVVAGVRSVIAEVATLPVSDMAGHTRALLLAAGRALAERRGPTEPELAFVEQLARTRARQGIPIEVVLAAIRVSERAIWSRARELAAVRGLSEGQLLDARELYDDWADAVRTRLIRAHREAPAAPESAERRVRVVRRLLEGGTAATLAAAEAGFSSGSPLWVLVTRGGDPDAARSLRRRVGTRGASVVAQVDDTLVGVCGSAPGLQDPATTGSAVARGVVGIAGPVPADELGAAYRLAVAAVPAAETVGRAGAVHVADVASVVALRSRTDLAATLVARHQAARDALGSSAVPVARTVRAWLEADRDARAAARAAYVHHNTVRNRVHRFSEVTGIDPAGVFGAMDAWWLCLAWTGPGTDTGTGTGTGTGEDPDRSAGR